MGQPDRSSDKDPNRGTDGADAPAYALDDPKPTGAENGADAQESTTEAATTTPAAQGTGLSATTADALTGDTAATPAVPAQPEAVAIAELGAIHKDFVEKRKGIDAATAQADEATLRGETVEEIRYNSRLLKKNEANETPEVQVASLKEETARRMRAYTTDSGDGWFSLDYAKFGADKTGLTHELNIGLGDVLLDPDVKEVVIEQNGQVIRAHRGIVASGRYVGRIGFLDDKNDYVATYTGDKFRILSDAKMQTVGYVAEVTKEDASRATNREVFKRSPDVQFAVNENPVTMKDDISLTTTYKSESGRDVQVAVTNQTITDAERECATQAGKITDVVAERTNLMKILNYIAAEVGVPASAILAIIYRETGVTFPGPKDGDGGRAFGMGQFHGGSWAEQKKDSKFSELVGKVIKEDPTDAKRGGNIFVDLVGIAICLKKASEIFGVDLSKSVSDLESRKLSFSGGPEMSVFAWMRTYFHVPGHAKVYASLIKGENAVDKYGAARVAEAKTWLENPDLLRRYNLYSNLTVAANRAIQDQGQATA
ncbi:MAG: hypothetical protein WC285_02495 [Candidatus Gracilibacteria bacterium]|jgi:hypothetical protein